MFSIEYQIDFLNTKRGENKRNVIFRQFHYKQGFCYERQTNQSASLQSVV